MSESDDKDYIGYPEHITGKAFDECKSDYCSQNRWKPDGRDICLRCSTKIVNNLRDLRKNFKDDNMSPSEVEGEISNILNEQGASKDHLSSEAQEEIRLIVQKMQ